MNENPYYQFEEISEQINLITINPIDPSKEQFDDYCDFASKLFSSDSKSVSIMDISKAKFLSSEQRIKIGKVIESNKLNLQENCAGIAYINTSVVASIVLKGILLVSPIPIPSKVCGSREEAIDWCTKQLKEKDWHITEQH